MKQWRVEGNLWRMRSMSSTQEWNQGRHVATVCRVLFTEDLDHDRLATAAIQHEGDDAIRRRTAGLFRWCSPGADTPHRRAARSLAMKARAGFAGRFAKHKRRSQMMQEQKIIKNKLGLLKLAQTDQADIRAGNSSSVIGMSVRSSLAKTEK
jgi:hypothetical protein